MLVVLCGVFRGSTGKQGYISIVTIDLPSNLNTCQCDTSFRISRCVDEHNFERNGPLTCSVTQASPSHWSTESGHGVGWKTRAPGQSVGWELWRRRLKRWV